jgi:hypothetical protein
MPGVKFRPGKRPTRGSSGRASAPRARGPTPRSSVGHSSVIGTSPATFMLSCRWAEGGETSCVSACVASDEYIFVSEPLDVLGIPPKALPRLVQGAGIVLTERGPLFAFQPGLVNYRPEYQHDWGIKTYYTQLRIDPLAPESAKNCSRQSSARRRAVNGQRR